ncbi:MAG TPA: Gldg family protein [Steroidobacteraceae bacterium]|nr:Gldg family protein [Steroidobacteraceae bacterium]
MGPSKIRSLGAATFIVLAVLFVGLTVLINQTLSGARLDLTENRLYTLSPGTERLVSAVKEPINLYFFFSQQASVSAPPLRAYAVRVRELLEEITARSGGHIRLHVIDPQPYSDDEDRAGELGLRPIPIGNGTDSLWFGLAGSNSTDGRAVIEFFQPQREEFLEYDVVRLVHQLAAPTRKVVGLVSSLPMAGGFDPASGGLRQPWVIDAELAELFDIRPIAATATALPAGLDALIVVHPKGLTPALSYAIDQFVVGGGHLFLCVDPDAQLDAGAAAGPAEYAGSDRSSTFEPMLAAWGIGYDPRQAFGDLEHALLVGNPGGGEPVRHLGFAGFGVENLAKRDVITASLDTINFGTPGFLVAHAVPGVTFEPLITSGKNAAPIPVERFALAATPDSLRQGFKPTGERYVVAARISGLLPSAYPAGPPPGVTAAAPHVARGAKAANLVVVADTDFLLDMLWVRAGNLLGQRFAEPWASNGDFVLNAIDNLTGNADLIGIRGRASFSRPFTRVDRLRAQADERLRAKEVELERELATTESKLTDLQTRRADRASLVLTPEQRGELERFQQEKLRIRKELRSVRHGLEQEIDRLGTVLKIINVTAVPLLLSVATLVLMWLRQRRRRSRRRLAA